MKKLINELIELCPGRFHLTINQHKVYDETAEDLLLREDRQFSDTPEKIKQLMASTDTIIQVDAAPTTKPMPPVLVFHYDIELALKEALKQIKNWKP